MTDSITAAILAAQNAAANMGGLVTTDQSQQAVASYTAATAPALTADSLLVGGALNPDAWLKVNEYGLLIGTDKTFREELKVSIDLSEVGYCYTIKYGNPTIYKKTYDRVRSVENTPWNEVIRIAQQVQPTARDFPSADLPFTMMETIMGPDKKTPLISEGQTLGHSLSQTGWSSFSKILGAVKKAGAPNDSGIYELTLGYEPKSNPKGTWGVLVFKDFVPAAD